MDWFYFALLSAFSLAVADAFTKKFFQQQNVWELLLIRFTIPGILLIPGALQSVLPGLASPFWLWVGALIPLELIAMMIYSMAIRDSALHLTLPYLAFTPVINVVTGQLLLGETVSLKKLFGIVLVVCGAYILNCSRQVFSHPRYLLLPLKAIVTERGSRLMLLAAVIYSFTSVMGKGALHYMDPHNFGAIYFFIMGCASLFLVAVTKPDSIKVLRVKPWQVLIVAVCMSAMVITHFIAIAQVQVAYMIAVKRTSLLFGIILGALMFGEKQLTQHLIAGLLMVVGVAAILI